MPLVLFCSVDYLNCIHACDINNYYLSGVYLYVYIGDTRAVALSVSLSLLHTFKTVDDKV